MKVLFVENRYKTWLWQSVAEDLITRGHEVSWIVQNHGFMPSHGSVHSIRYPRDDEGSPELTLDSLIQKTLNADRNINYFGGNSSHYSYYDNEIRQILSTVQPDVVFGESTLFHELLTIRQCQKLKIPYLHPTSSRYPTGRFAFYLNDTLEPQWGSGESFSQEEAESWVVRINKRQSVPDYMKSLKKQPNNLPKISKLESSLRITLNYFYGERFNTPAPWRKLQLTKRRKQNIARWDELAQSAPVGKFAVLYPLQYQPESNLDVWGYKYNDQPKLIARLAENLPDGVVLLLKPNPKSYYEISEKLLEVVASLPKNRVFPLHHSVGMAEIFDSISLFVTVTGTVAIEAALADKPIVTLLNTLNNEMPGCKYLEDPDELPEIIDNIKSGKFPRTTSEQKTAFIQKLVSTSHEGVISDPLSDPNIINKSNMANIHKAFHHVINEIEKTKSVSYETVSPAMPDLLG